MRAMSCLVAGIAFMAAAPAGVMPAGAATMMLVGPDGPAPVIVIGADAGPAERYAARELATYLERITDTTIETVDDTAIPAGTIIAVGRSALTASMATAGLDPEQYIIHVGPKLLAIVGGRRAMRPGRPARDCGTLYGVYEFLESLGVRWYRPEPWGEHVPSMAEIELEMGTRVSPKPSYRLRSTLGGGQWYFREESAEEIERAAIWAVRNRLNAACRISDPERDAALGGREAYAWGHIYSRMIPPAEFFDSHPEYFALIDGQRRPVDLCLGNPELQRLFADRLIARARDLPYMTSLSVEPDDCRGSQCECELCRAMDEPHNPRVGGQGSNRVAAFANIMARMVAAEAPWVKLQWLAYSSHTAAPTNLERLEPNTIIMPAPINAWDDWRRPLLDESSPANRRFVQTLADWRALRPSCLMIYQYWEGYGWPGPLPITRTVADRLRSYRTLGVKGLYWEAVMSWGPQGLDYYMTARLAWNPDLDVDRELQLYYRNYYGPAAEPMAAYHERWMDALAQAEYPVHSGGRGMHLVCTPALIAELGEYMDQARALVAGQPLYERRLGGVWAGYEFARRISEILTLRKRHGVPVDRPGWEGRAWYLRSTEAEDAYRELIRWMRGVNAEAPVFDMAAQFDCDVAEVIFPEGNAGACWLSYLPGDVLRDRLVPIGQEQAALAAF